MLPLGIEDAARLLKPALQQAAIEAVEPMTGGLVNSNFRVAMLGERPPLVLRLYQRDPAQAAKEAALHALVGGAVPVPRVLYRSADNPVSGGPYAVLEWIDGQLMDDVAPELGTDELAGLGRAVGGVLAAIHRFRFPVHGFLGPDLAIAKPIDIYPRGVAAFLRKRLIEGRGGVRLGYELSRRVVARAEIEGPLVETWLDPPCLVHADFNGANILVRREAGKWRIAAVLDWEFALSATPAMDFGNLLRFPYGSGEVFADAVAAGYRAAGGRLPDQWQRIAAIVDLTSWADFLDRPEASPAFIADARRVIARTVGSA